MSSEKGKQRKGRNFGDCVLSNHCHIKILDVSQVRLSTGCSATFWQLLLFRFEQLFAF